MNIFYIITVIGILLAILQNPAEALTTAQTTLDSWWYKVLPALLPFFIISELCARLGFINALSIWLTPIMQPLFRLPGAAALCLLLGFFSGSPTGGSVAANLRQQNLITRNEGERMLAFCNNVGPLYLLITVAALLQQPAVGVWLALVQYPVNLALGLLLRFFARDNQLTPSRPQSAAQLWRSGLSALQNTTPQPISLLLKQSSLQALTNIGMIGAFMLCFSLLLLALKQCGLILLLHWLLSPLCRLFDLPPAVLPGLCDGFFEMTLGVQAVAAADTDLFSKLLAASIILGWSGLSIHSQIAGVISHTDLTLRYYLPCRVVHCLAAPLLLSLFAPHINLTSSTFADFSLPSWLLLPGALLLPALALLLLMLGLSFLICRRCN